MQDRVDQHRECSQSDFLMPPWKNDKKGAEDSDPDATGIPHHSAWAVARILFSILIRSLQEGIDALQQGTTKMTHPAKTFGQGNLGVDLDLGLT